jgi:hypothetical protein
VYVRVLPKNTRRVNTTYRPNSNIVFIAVIIIMITVIAVIIIVVVNVLGVGVVRLEIQAHI